jgi:hypothetical protein
MVELCKPGLHLTVDEGMIRYTGRNKQVTYVPNKPIDISLLLYAVVVVFRRNTTNLARARCRVVRARVMSVGGQ